MKKFMIYIKEAFIIKDKDEIRENIQKNYAKIAIRGSAGGCCNSGP